MRYIAFLRAINVGGHTVRMEQLRALLGALGMRNVETFIASGNAIFDAAGSAVSIERRIEERLERLERELGYMVPTFLRTPAEIAAVAAHKPFRGLGVVPPSAMLQVGFLKSPLEAEAHAGLMAFRDDVHDFHVRGREIYWHARERRAILQITGSKMDRVLRGPATFRNITTVRKLAEKYA
ncbi:MAG: DUF1697 domain-containing protein [Gemmatimonadaceae bacterium]